MHPIRVTALCLVLLVLMWHSASLSACGAGAVLGDDEKNGMPAVADLVQDAAVPGEFKSVELIHKTFSPDRNIYAGYYRYGWDETISIHDAKTGKQIHRIVGHGDAVERFRFASDGKVLATWSLRRGWKLWDASTGRLLLELSK